MAGDSITVLEYPTEDGRQPFSEWLEKLRDLEVAQRVDARLSRMRLGNAGDARFGRKGSRLVILRCGGDKRTQQSEVQRAQAYWADYLERTS